MLEGIKLGRKKCRILVLGMIVWFGFWFSFGLCVWMGFPHFFFFCFGFGGN